jgi:hypothetical protein
MDERYADATNAELIQSATPPWDLDPSMADGFRVRLGWRADRAKVS